MVAPGISEAARGGRLDDLEMRLFAIQQVIDPGPGVRDRIIIRREVGAGMMSLSKGRDVLHEIAQESVIRGDGPVAVNHGSVLVVEYVAVAFEQTECRCGFPGPSGLP